MFFYTSGVAYCFLSIVSFWGNMPPLLHRVLHQLCPSSHKLGQLTFFPKKNQGWVVQTAAPSRNSISSCFQYYPVSTETRVFHCIFSVASYPVFFLKNPFLFELTRTYVGWLEWNKSNIENKEKLKVRQEDTTFSINIKIK